MSRDRGTKKVATRRRGIAISSETDPTGRWAVVLEHEAAGIAVRVVEAVTGKTTSVLSPREYLPYGVDLPLCDWSPNSKCLAIATLKGLWSWKPGERTFRNAATWSWQVKEV